MEAYLAWALVGSAATVAVFWATDARSRWQWRRRILSRDMDRYDRLAEQLSRGDEAFIRTLLQRREWTGFRNFRLLRRETEADGIHSLVLQPHDGRPVQGHAAGQFLTVRFYLPGEAEPTVRCYSLSRAHAGGREYRITVRHQPPPPDAPPGTPWGRASTHLCRTMEVGQILEVAPPAGEFTLERAAGRPLVLIAGGVGITPFLAMLDELQRNDPGREVWLFRSVRRRADRVDLGPGPAGLREVVCITGAGAEDGPPGEREHRGRISVDLLRRWLPSSNYEFYLCGPPAMNRALAGDLRAWGVPDATIHSEVFSSPTQQAVRRTAIADGPEDRRHEIRFRRAGASLTWTPADGTLLDLALAHGVHLPSGCRLGNCGTCATPVLAGEARALSRPAVPVEGGSCLVCISVPESDMELA